MSERIDSFAKTVAERTTRRSALLGLGALALGSLGLFGLGQETEAKQNNEQQQKQSVQHVQEFVQGKQQEEGQDEPE